MAHTQLKLAQVPKPVNRLYSSFFQLALLVRACSQVTSTPSPRLVGWLVRVLREKPGRKGKGQEYPRFRLAYFGHPQLTLFQLVENFGFFLCVKKEGEKNSLAQSGV